MFIALSQFTVANNMTAEVKNAFVDRPHLVDDTSGFIRLEVISHLAASSGWASYWRAVTASASRARSESRIRQMVLLASGVIIFLKTRRARRIEGGRFSERALSLLEFPCESRDRDGRDARS